MTEPQVILGDYEGRQNLEFDAAKERLLRGKGYQDLSTVCVIPTRGQIPARVVESWMGLQPPMNQKFTRVFVAGMEVGAAYSHAIETILQHPVLKDWKYLLTLEEDNMPPPDGLIRLYESMDDFDVVGGLYWTKGPEGQPMIYGNPEEPLNFMPQVPVPDTVQRAHGLGMGFTLFKMDLFRDGKLERPFFQTVQTFDPTGVRAYSQDLDFFERAGKQGYRFACDTRVKVGHFDPEGGIVW